METVSNLNQIDITDKFTAGSIRPEIAKLYVLKDDIFFRLLSATFKPINEVLENDFQFILDNNSEKIEFKKRAKFDLFIWTFHGLSKNQLESVCLELNFKIKEKYGQWSIMNSKITFDNTFEYGKLIANDAFKVLETHQTYGNYWIENKKHSDKIFEAPFQYGFRGDIHLWKELKIIYENSKIKNIDEFQNFLYNTFKEVTLNAPLSGKNFHVERYHFGGMSSGMICSDFWIEKGFPLLIDRFKQMQKSKNRKPQKIKLTPSRIFPSIASLQPKCL
jgi:hypothetical protein